MINPSTKNSDLPSIGFDNKTMNTAIEAVKSEVDHISKATRNAASLVAAEVVKRPLTYTLAAAGAGALVGLGLMAVINRPRSSAH